MEGKINNKVTKLFQEEKMKLDLTIELGFAGIPPNSYNEKKTIPVNVYSSQNKIEVFPEIRNITWKNQPSLLEKIRYVLLNPKVQYTHFNLYIRDTLIGIGRQPYPIGIGLLDSEFMLVWDYDTPIIRVDASSINLDGLHILLGLIKNDKGHK